MGPDAPWVLALWVEAARQALGFPVAEGRVSGLLGFTLLGEAMREALDPKLRG